MPTKAAVSWGARGLGTTGVKGRVGVGHRKHEGMGSLEGEKTGWWGGWTIQGVSLGNSCEKCKHAQGGKTQRGGKTNGAKGGKRFKLSSRKKGRLEGLPLKKGREE